MKKKAPTNWIPEIMYEEESQIPFIDVPANESDPAMLFIFVNRKTGESELSPDGDELPIVEMDLRQFVDMKVLRENLTVAEYDKVRGILGLAPMHEAVPKGRNITAAVEKNIRN